jgi:hypothetical protein
MGVWWRTAVGEGKCGRGRSRLGLLTTQTSSSATASQCYFWDLPDYIETFVHWPGTSTIPYIVNTSRKVSASLLGFLIELHLQEEVGGQGHSDVAWVGFGNDYAFGINGFFLMGASARCS